MPVHSPLVHIVESVDKHSHLVHIIESVDEHAEPDGQYDDSGNDADDADDVADSHHGAGLVGGRLSSV